MDETSKRLKSEEGIEKQSSIFLPIFAFGLFAFYPCIFREICGF